jgi:hypothetical protein
MSMVVVWFIAAFAGTDSGGMQQFGPFATEYQCTEAIETIKVAGGPAHARYVCIRGAAVVPAEIPGR